MPDDVPPPPEELPATPELLEPVFDPVELEVGNLEPVVAPVEPLDRPAVEVAAPVPPLVPSLIFPETAQPTPATRRSVR
jgi:hypothetical protein